MKLQDPELMQARRLLTVLQWVAVAGMLLMVLAGLLSLGLHATAATEASTTFKLLSLVSLLMVAAVTLPMVLIIRQRQQSLGTIDALLRAEAGRSLEMQRRFGFTGLVALRPIMRTAVARSTGGLEPAWWLQPMVPRNRQPRFGRCSVHAHWHPPTAGRLLAWRADKLGWGRVLSAAEVRRQGWQIGLILLGFGLLVPALLGAIMTVIAQDISASMNLVETAQGLAGEMKESRALQEEFARQQQLLWMLLAVLPLLTVLLAALTWRESQRMAAVALDPDQL